VLGYGWFFVDALMVMVLAIIYLSAGGQPIAGLERRSQ
jgi:hypothetical protein